ncbi:thiol reductant ABC exporter subunit CydC [Neorhizobium sp. NPDC001467]|uniref:thiol reductant ABC exporter subunit CydC n=1 Tax=Neorhizobium sp. NPDC001467 TaxID=3390595 RepID=UPI003D0742B2
MKSLLSFRPLFGRHAGGFAVTLTLSLLTLICGIALLGLSGWFLTAAFLTAAAMSFNLFGPSAAVRLLSFLRIAFRYGERVTGHDATLKVLADIRIWVFTRLKPEQIRAPHLRRGDIISRLTADVEALDSVYIVAGGPLLTGLLASAATTSALALLLPAAALPYAVLFACAGIVVPFLLCTATRERGKAIVRHMTALRIATLDIIEGQDEIATFGAAMRVRVEAACIADDLARERLYLARMSSLASAAISACAGLALLATLVSGLQAFEAGTLGAAMAVGLLFAVIGSFEATAQVVRLVAKLTTAMAAAERLQEMAQAPAAVLETVEPTAPAPSAMIKLDRVVFGYCDRPVFHAVDMTLHPGERVAIKGRSGSGKSTLAALLLRLADPLSGTIHMGGVDIRELAMTDLRERIALLEQDAPVFIGSVRENLIIGRADADDQACWAALETACLADLIRSSPAGLDMQVGEAGRTLSVGQARRLCLARTLLSKAPILILDEPTSGLDRDTAGAFWTDLKHAMAGRTVLLITHAEPPADTVDRTYEMRNGRLFAVPSGG